MAALRVVAVTENDEDIFDKAKKAGINRLVMPMTHQCAENARLAQNKGLEISFYTEGMTSPLASNLIIEMKEAGLDPRFTFNAANMAKLREKPFLKSYKLKLRRFVDQLDIEDATWGGDTTVLAGGNAEIKEMMSILRCASFTGWFVLTASNALVGNLKDAAGRFVYLLDRV